jgi:hypothetical protein
LCIEVMCAVQLEFKQADIVEANKLDPNIRSDGRSIHPLPNIYQDKLQEDTVNLIKSTGVIFVFSYNTKLDGQPIESVFIGDNEGVNDSSLAYLKPLSHLQKVEIRGCDYFSGTGLKELEKLKDLRELKIIDCGITDEGLKGIQGLKQIENLLIDSDTITDVAYEHIKELKNLKSLDANISDKGLIYIKTLTKLDSLSISGKKVTDKGIEQLKDLQNLKYLYLSSKSLTNAGIKHFQDMKQLRYLTISYSTLDDSSIDDLSKLNQLETLQLRYSKISKEGIDKLQINLPKTKIKE